MPVLTSAAEIGGIAHDVQLSTNGQTFVPDLIGASAVDPGAAVTVRLVYNNRTSAAVTNASVRALLEAGFTYVSGTTRNCITPAPGEIVCNDSPGQAGAINEASVWSSSTDLTISPTAGLYDISPGQRQGVFEMGKKRYLNFQNCDYALVNGSNTDDIYGFQPGNVRIDAVTCGPGGNGTYHRSAQSLRNVVDLIARRYANMQDCDYALMNNLNTDDIVNFAPSNTPFTALTCGTSTDPNVYYRAANSLFAAGDHLGKRYLNFSDCDYINLSNSNTDDVVTLHPSNTPLTSYVCGGAVPGTAFRAQNSMFDPLDLLDTARGSGYIQFRMRAPQNPGVYTVTSTVSGNGISAVTDTAQVEVRGGNNACSARNEYTMTLSSSFYYSPLGQASGSATACTSASPGAGWTLADQECLISGGPCYTQVCLWRRPTPVSLEYTMTRAGGNYPDSLSCATTPPAGYSLKARGCAANNSVAPYYCFSDVCLWEKSGTAADLLFSHAGSNGTAVDCRQSSPGAGYSTKAQICILSNGPCFSDLCLWQRTNSCPPPASACSDTLDNDNDNLTDSQDPGCHTDGNPNNPNSYDPTDNNEFNQQVPQCSDGVDNADPEDTLVDIYDPGCHTDGNPNNPNSYSPNDNNEQNQQQVPQCSDGFDNDNDNLTDSQDPGCHTDGNPNNPNSYSPNDNNEQNQQQVPQCSDGFDNDNDTLVDIYDPGCHTDGNFSNPNSYDPNDNSEAIQVTVPQCRDGYDNDNDGQVDIYDPGCHMDGNPNNPNSYSPSDNDESNSSQLTGCIEVIKETYDTNGAVLTPVTQFSFRLDNNLVMQNLGDGRIRFQNVSAGSHTVTEEPKQGWIQITPATMQVTVSVGNTCAVLTFKNRQTVNTGNNTGNNNSCQSTTGNYEGQVCTNQNQPNQQSRFSDIDNVSTTGRAANYLAGRNIIGGYSDGTFRAANIVNRAETAKFLLLAKFGSVPEKVNNGRFWDVLDGQWYTKYVIDAADRGIISGYPDGSFKPDQGVTRAEFLKMLTLTFGLQQNLAYAYTDVNANDWFAQYAGAAQFYSLFPGTTTALNPNAPVTRGEIATAIWQILQALGL